MFLKKLEINEIQELCQKQQLVDLGYTQNDFENFNNLINFLNSLRIVVSERSETIINLLKEHCKEKRDWYRKEEKISQDFKERDTLIIEQAKQILADNPTKQEIKLLQKIIPIKTQAIMEGFFLEV